ncbi:MAG: hypothetical protein JNL82_18785 [Myxococcales bacterium]|nr:hypothetical protein [Myxococcales bacterium]
MHSHHPISHHSLFRLCALALTLQTGCDDPVEAGDDPGDGAAADAAAEDEAAEPAFRAGNPCRILALGDSITHGINSNALQAADPFNTYGGGYRAHLVASYFFNPSTAVGPILMVGRVNWNANPALLAMHQEYHSGYSGVTAGGLANQVSYSDPLDPNNPLYNIADFDPDIILLHIGTNNMFQSPYPQSSFALVELNSLLSALDAKAPDATILLAKILPLVGASAPLNPQVDLYNASLDSIALTRRNLGQDVWTVDQNSYFPTYTLEDGIHPNWYGYEHMAARWRLAMEGVGC